MRAKVKDLEKAMIDSELNGGGLAKAASVGPNTVTTVRNGGYVSEKTAKAIAYALGRKVEELFVAGEPAQTEKAA